MDSLREIGEQLRGRGPLGVALAEYLATRLDVLTPAQAARVGQPAHVAPASPASKTVPGPSAPAATPFVAVRKRFSEDFGRRVEDVFAAFESEPFEVGPLFQWHRARLASGEPVVCKTRHPEIEAELGAGPAVTARVEAELRRLPERWTSKQRSRLAGEFVAALEHALDLNREAGDLITLRERFEDLKLVTASAVFDEASGERFLTIADLGGATLSQVAERGAEDRSRLARRACRAWLRAVLVASRVPVAPAGQGLLLLADGAVAFAGGPFHELPGRVRARLGRYLSATAIEEHDSQLDELIALGAPMSRRGEGRLRHVLRHTEPFRDGEWEPESDRLASHALTQWRQAVHLGFRPRPELVSFLRGLAVMTRQVAALAPEQSSFKEAYQETRLHELFTESSRFSVGAAAMPLAALPAKLDRALRRATRDRTRSRRPKARDRDPAGSWRLTAALLLALGAVALLVHYVAPLSSSPAWIEGAGFLAMLALGGNLFRLA